MRIKLDKQMRRQHRPDEDWETYNPASTYQTTTTDSFQRRRGEYDENFLTCSRVNASQFGLSDAMHLYIGTQDGTSLLEVGVGVVYDYQTHQHVSDALANESKYQDFYGVLALIGYSPVDSIIREAIDQIQEMVNHARGE